MLRATLSKDAGAHGDVEELASGDVAKLVAESDVPVLVKFGAPLCSPCRAIAPELADIAKRYQGRLQVVSVDIDDDRSVLERYGFMKIPTLVLFVDGSQHGSFTGIKTRSGIESVLSLADVCATARRSPPGGAG
jgi:thioredoxin 1